MTHSTDKGRLSMKWLLIWIGPFCILLIGVAWYWVNHGRAHRTQSPPSPALVNAAQPVSSPYSQTVEAASSLDSGTDGVDPMLDDIRKNVIREIEKKEDVQLAQVEMRLRQLLANGWKPPWRALDVKLTDDEIRNMPTQTLAAHLFATGVPAREMIAFGDRAPVVMKRLEVCYRGYSELFGRPDLLDAIIAGLEMSSYLSPDRPDRDNLNLVMALTAVPQMYGAAPIRDKIVGHERDLIKAHINALKNIRGYIVAMSTRTTTCLITPRSAIVLSNTAIEVAEQVAPSEARAARAALSQFPWKAGNEAESIVSYIDQSLGVLKALIE